MYSKEEFLTLLQKELAQALMHYSNLQKKDDIFIEQLVNDVFLLFYLQKWINTYYNNPLHLREKVLYLKKDYNWSITPDECTLFHWNLRCDFLEI